MLRKYRIVVEAGIVEGNEGCVAMCKKILDWNAIVVVLFCEPLGTNLHLVDPVVDVMFLNSMSSQTVFECQSMLSKVFRKFQPAMVVVVESIHIEDEYDHAADIKVD